jgi:hypothetical protein
MNKALIFIGGVMLIVINIWQGLHGDHIQFLGATLWIYLTATLLSKATPVKPKQYYVTHQQFLDWGIMQPSFQDSYLGVEANYGKVHKTKGIRLIDLLEWLAAYQYKGVVDLILRKDERVSRRWSTLKKENASRRIFELIEERAWMVIFE